MFFWFSDFPLSFPKEYNRIVTAIWTAATVYLDSTIRRQDHKKCIFRQAKYITESLKWTVKLCIFGCSKYTKLSRPFGRFCFVQMNNACSCIWMRPNGWPVWVFEFCHFESLSFVTTWVFEFSRNLGLVTIWVLELHFQLKFCHTLSFRVVTIWVLELSQLEFWSWHSLSWVLL